MFVPYRPIKKPIYLQSDRKIRAIREWRYIVRYLRMFRAENQCEICGKKYKGIYAEKELKGHHIIPPSQYQGRNPANTDNIAITCYACYKKYIIKGNPIPMPSLPPAVICAVFYQEPVSKWQRFKQFIRRINGKHKQTST